MKSTKLVLLATLALASVTQHLNAADSWFSGLKTRAERAWATTTQAARGAKKTAETNYEEWQKGQLAKQIASVRASIAAFKKRISELNNRISRNSNLGAIAEDLAMSISDQLKSLNDHLDRAATSLTVTVISAQDLIASSKLQKSLLEATKLLETGEIVFRRSQKALLLFTFDHLQRIIESSRVLPTVLHRTAMDTLNNLSIKINRLLEKTTQQAALNDRDIEVLFSDTDRIVSSLVAFARSAFAIENNSSRLRIHFINTYFRDGDLYIFYGLDTEFRTIERNLRNLIFKVIDTHYIITLKDLAAALQINHALKRLNQTLEESGLVFKTDLMHDVENETRKDSFPEEATTLLRRLKYARPSALDIKNIAEQFRTLQESVRTETELRKTAEAESIRSAELRKTAEVKVISSNETLIQNITALAGEVTSVTGDTKHPLIKELSDLLMKATGDASADPKGLQDAFNVLVIKFKKIVAEKQQQEDEAYQLSYRGQAANFIGSWFGGPSAKSSSDSKHRKSPRVFDPSDVAELQDQ